MFHHFFLCRARPLLPALRCPGELISFCECLRSREEHARAVREENERAAQIEVGISADGGQQGGDSGEEDSDDEDGEPTMVRFRMPDC